MFSLKRFSQLNRYIFFCDPHSLNDDEHDCSKLAKLKPFLEHLHAAFKENINCGKNTTIDDAMISYKGKLSTKHQILGKTVRWDPQLFPLRDSKTGYVSRFEVH